MIPLEPGLEDGLALLLSRASSASQSISDATSLAATQSLPRPHGTPRLPSPMPTPRPPREGRYRVRHFQILSYSTSELRRLRPQGWQSQTLSGHVQLSRFKVSALRVVGDGGSSWVFVEEAGWTSEERGTREQALQIRRWRWRRRIGAGGLIVQFLQTTRLHLLHSPTISLAQSPNLPAPVPRASLPPSTKYQSAARARYLNVCSGSGSMSSFSQ